MESPSLYGTGLPRASAGIVRFDPPTDCTGRGRGIQSRRESVEEWRVTDGSADCSRDAGPPFVFVVVEKTAGREHVESISPKESYCEPACN